MIPLLIGAYAAAVAMAPSTTAKLVLGAPALLAPTLFWTIFSERRWIAMFFICALLLPPLPIAIGDTGPHSALAVAALGLFAGMLRLREWDLRRWRFGAGNGSPCSRCCFRASRSRPCIQVSRVAAGSLARVLLFGIAVYMFFYVAYGPAGYDRFRSGAAHAAAVRGRLRIGVVRLRRFLLPVSRRLPDMDAQFVWLRSGVYSGARKACFTKRARWEIFARSSW